MYIGYQQDVELRAATLHAFAFREALPSFQCTLPRTKSHLFLVACAIYDLWSLQFQQYRYHAHSTSKYHIFVGVFRAKLSRQLADKMLPA